VSWISTEVIDVLRWEIGRALIHLGLWVMDSGPWEVWTGNYGSWDDRD
jgi:hypothetical protein